MLPINNDTGRDIRDSVVVQRKIRRQFVNFLGMHVFSTIQSFNSTYRKLVLVPCKCMRKVSTDPSFNIFQAGPEVKRVPTILEKYFKTSHIRGICGWGRNRYVLYRTRP